MKESAAADSAADGFPAGLLLRADASSVTLADIEGIREAMHDMLEARGLRLAMTRAVPITQAELESRDFGELLFSRMSPGHETPSHLL